MFKWALLGVIVLQSAAAQVALIPAVKEAIAANNFKLAEAMIESYKMQNGVTPEMVEAVSWLGRGKLAIRDADGADRYAVETRKLVLQKLNTQKLDAEPHLPLALGASIEVQANVLASRGQRSEAIHFLNQELATYRNTSIRARIQKNINLLSLEGQKAPALEIKQWLGPKPSSLDALKGKAVLLFFWAHWCSDCKRQAPILAQIRKEYGPKGLELIGPTQRYGYVAKGKDAGPEEELKYIDQVRHEFYSGLLDMPAPVSEENFKVYGSSTTPTLVLLDRKGLVRLYHPGTMNYQELAGVVSEALR
jgi:thiol-disulfide isomerase/thioredoxin